MSSYEHLKVAEVPLQPFPIAYAARIKACCALYCCHGVMAYVDYDPVSVAFYL